MSDVLAQGKSIEIRGFGSFSITEYKGYEGSAPKTREKFHVTPNRLPVFKVGKDLRERVNEGK
jgi:integration host factor subunit beta